MRQLETIEAVTKIRFPGARVRVAIPFDYDRVDVFVYYHLWRGKRQHTGRYARFSISGMVIHKYSELLPEIIPVELESMAYDVDEMLEKARLVGWKRDERFNY